MRVTTLFPLRENERLLTLFSCTSRNFSRLRSSFSSFLFPSVQSSLPSPSFVFLSWVTCNFFRCSILPFLIPEDLLMWAAWIERNGRNGKWEAREVGEGDWSSWSSLPPNDGKVRSSPIVQWENEENEMKLREIFWFTLHFWEGKWIDKKSDKGFGEVPFVWVTFIKVPIFCSSSCSLLRIPLRESVLLTTKNCLVSRRDSSKRTVMRL